MSDLIDNLENLGPEELKAVSNLINKLAKRKRKESIDSTRDDVVDEPEPTPSPKPKRRQQGRAKPLDARNIRRKDNVRKRGASRGAAARTEPVVLNNQNKFLQMREKNSHKEDAEIDKKLWGNRKPTERPEEFQFVEVQCKECGMWYDINPELAYMDQDTKTVNFTCDNCVPRGR